jgi:hypothetical protein
MCVLLVNADPGQHTRCADTKQKAQAALAYYQTHTVFEMLHMEMNPDFSFAFDIWDPNLGVVRMMQPELAGQQEKFGSMSRVRALSVGAAPFFCHDLV